MGNPVGDWRSDLLVRHDRLDVDCLVDEAEWPSIVTFFDGDGAGTLVAEGWVLTAAHTAANLPGGHRIRVAGREARIGRVVVHPGRMARPPLPVDLALVELDPPAAGVPTLGLFEGDDEVGREVLLLGRGDFGNGRDGVVGTDHRLRLVTNRVDGIVHPLTDEPWGVRRFFVNDPNGVTVNVVGHRGDEAASS